MSKETKIGIFAILSIVAAIWGYKFLKGQNIISRSNIFYVVYDDVDNLPVSSPVLINGLQVGIVQDLYLNAKNPEEVIVVLDVNRRVSIPKNARAIMQTTSFLGNKAITLSYRGVCLDDCAMSGDTLVGEVAGLLETMLPETTLEKYFTLIKTNIGDVVDSITTRMEQSGIESGQSIEDIKKTISNIRSITDNMDKLIANSSGNIQRITKNLEAISGNLDRNQDQINQIMANAARVSEELATLDLAALAGKAGTALESMDGTLSELKKAGESLSSLLADIKEGDGTIGLMMKDPAVYENLERTTRNLDLLLQDLRLNPKRYVNVSVFGKRQKAYELPEDDPAFKDEIPAMRGAEKTNER